MSNFAQLEKEIGYIAKGSTLSWRGECARLIEASILLCNTDAGDEACGLFYSRIVDSYFVAARKTGDKFLRTYQGMPQIHQGTGSPSLAMRVRTEEGHFAPRGLAFLMDGGDYFSVRIKHRDEVRMSCLSREVRWFAPLMRNPGVYPDESHGRGASDRGRVLQKVPALFKPPASGVFNLAQRGFGERHFCLMDENRLAEVSRQRGS